MSKNSYILIKSIDGLRIISKFHLNIIRFVIDDKIYYCEKPMDLDSKPSNIILFKYFKRNNYYLNKKYKHLAKELKINL